MNSDAALPEHHDVSARQPVAYLVSYYPMLAQTFVRQEIEGLEALGRRVEVFSVNDPAEGEAEVAGAAEVIAATTYLKSMPPAKIAASLFSLVRTAPNVLVKELLAAVAFGGLDVGSKLKRLFHLVEAIILWDACRTRGLRHIHSQFGGPTTSVAMLAKRIADGTGGGLEYSFIVHGHTDFMDEPGIDLPSKVPGATFVVGISDFLRSQILRQVHPRYWSKVHTIRVGIDIDGYDGTGASRPVVGDPKILTVGRLSAEKGQTVLFEALAILKERGIRAQLTMIGGGPMRDELEAMAIEAGVGDQVDFRGQQPPSVVRETLAESDVFCMASFAEGIPVSIMEAIAARTPVVTTRIMGIPELIIDGETGLAVAPGRADELADALERCVTDDRLRATMTASALDLLRVKHDRRQNLAELEELFVTHVDAAG